MELQVAGQLKERLHDWRVEQKEAFREGDGVEVQVEVLEGAVQDAVEEVQGEVLEEVQISGVVDQLQEELECPCCAHAPVLWESG